MIPLPPSLPPSPPSPFPVLLCTEQVRTIRGFQDCSMEFAVFFDKGAQRAGVEQRREDARAAFARGEEAMRAGDHAKGIYYPSHPPTHPPTPTACLLHLHAQRVDLPVLSPGSVSLPHSQKRVLGLFVPHGQPGGARRHSSPSAVAIRVKYLHCKQRHQQCGKRRRVDTS